METTPTMSAEIRVRSGERPEIFLTVRLIRTWKRGEIIPVQSTSSGLKLYLKNLVWAAFEAAPQAEAISMIRASGPPFLLLRVGQKYFDVAGKEVEVLQKREEVKLHTTIKIALAWRT